MYKYIAVKVTNLYKLQVTTFKNHPNNINKNTVYTFDSNEANLLDLKLIVPGTRLGNTNFNSIHCNIN